MKKGVWACGLLLLMPSWGYSNLWEEHVSQEIKKGCYLTARVLLWDELRHVPKNSAARRLLEKLNNRVATELKGENGPLSQAYGLAYHASENGDYDKARNHWYRYLEFDKRRMAAGTEVRRQEVMKFLSKIQEKVRPLSVVAPTPIPKAPAQKTKPSAPVAKKPLDPDIDLMVVRADKAIGSGQLEYAVHLLKMAIQADPERSDIQRRIERLREEME